MSVLSITGKSKTQQWQSICDAGNAVSAEGCTITEIKRKFDMKIEAKTSIAQAKRSITTTGEGQVTIMKLNLVHNR